MTRLSCTAFGRLLTVPVNGGRPWVIMSKSASRFLQRFRERHGRDPGKVKGTKWRIPLPKTKKQRRGKVRRKPKTQLAHESSRELAQVSHRRATIQRKGESQSRGAASSSSQPAPTKIKKPTVVGANKTNPSPPDDTFDRIQSHWKNDERRVKGIVKRIETEALEATIDIVDPMERRSACIRSAQETLSRLPRNRRVPAPNILRQPSGRLFNSIEQLAKPGHKDERCDATARRTAYLATNTSPPPALTRLVAANPAVSRNTPVIYTFPSLVSFSS